ncbi:hypothetical protein BGW41_006050 [Actinomortierella wolfii]|nr:hypothetical protein BGW41_006050 [Actinomortierella wolfii]
MASQQQQQHLRHNQSYPTGQHPRTQSQQHAFPHPPPTQQPPPLPQQHHVKPTAGGGSGGSDRQNRPPAPPNYQPRLHHSYSAGNIALAAATSKNPGANNAGGAQAAPKKKDPYATAWRTYSKIAEELDLANPDGSLYPISKESILKYLHHQSKRIKSSNLHWYVNGLKKHQENLGFPWDEVRYDEEVVALLKELTLHPVMQQEREARENREVNNDDDRSGRGRQRQTSGATSASYTNSAQQQAQHQHQYQGSNKHDPMAYLQQPPPNFQPNYASSSSRTSQSPSQRTYYHSAPIQVVSSPMSPQSSGNGSRRGDNAHPAATRHYTSQPINTVTIHATLANADKSVPPIDTRSDYMQSTLSKRKRFESMKRRVPSPMSPGDEEDELQEDEPREDDEDSRGARHSRGMYDEDDDEQMEDSSQYQPLKRRASTGTLLNQARAQAVNHVPGPYDINKLRGYKGEIDRADDGYDAGLKDRSGGYYSSHSSSADPASPPTTSSSMFRRPPTERAPQSPPQGPGLSPPSGGGGKTTVQFTQVVDCAQRLQAKYGGRCSDHPWGCVETPSGEHLELTIKMYLDWAGLVASGRLTMDELPDLVEFKRQGTQSGFNQGLNGGDERSGGLKRMSSTPMGFHSQQASVDSRYQGDDPMSPTSPDSSQQELTGFSASSAHSRAMSSGGPGYSDHHQHHHRSHHPSGNSSSHRHTQSHSHHHHQRESSEGYRRSPHRMYSSPPRHPLPSPPPNYNSPTSSSFAHQEQPMSFTSAGMGIGVMAGETTASGEAASALGNGVNSGNTSGREAKARRMASSPSLGRHQHQQQHRPPREFYSQPLTIPVFNFSAGGASHQQQEEENGPAAGEQLRHHSSSPNDGGRTQGHSQPTSMSSENEGSDEEMDESSYNDRRHRLRSPKSRLNGQPTMESFGSRLGRHEQTEELRRASGDEGLEGSDEHRYKSSTDSNHSFKVTSHIGDGRAERGNMEDDLEREVNDIGEIGVASAPKKGGAGGPPGFYEGIPNIQSTDPAFGQARSRARTRTWSGDIEEEEDKEEDDDDEYDEDIVMSTDFKGDSRGSSSLSSSSSIQGRRPGSHPQHQRLYDQQHLALHREGVKKEEVALAEQLHHQHQVDSLTERANTITLAPAANLASPTSPLSSSSSSAIKGSRDVTPSQSSPAPTSATTAAKVPVATTITNPAAKTAADASVPSEGLRTLAAEDINNEAMDED